MPGWSWAIQEVLIFTEVSYLFKNNVLKNRDICFGAIVPLFSFLCALSLSLLNEALFLLI